MAQAGLAATDDDDIKVIVEDDGETVRTDPITGAIEVDTDDGGVVVHINPQQQSAAEDAADPQKFYENIASKIGESKRSTIANDLLQAIDVDDRSRSVWLANRAAGMALLGIELKEPQTSAAGDSSGALEGLSTVTNPLLLEACLKGWANAQAELLPASGPCKVEDVGSEDSEQSTQLADALETGVNSYLTDVAKEYYPDTSKMLLWGTYFSGSGFKKVYRDPIKRRPTSISVDPKNLIVSDTAHDLTTCERITHEIPMRRSMLKRLILAKHYLDVTLTQPTPTTNAVDQKVASIQGTVALPERPEDQPYTIYECQCELDLDEFAPAKFKGSGIALPYLVTIEKDSQLILAIRRDWKPEDEECERKKMFVRYPYVPGPGFYGTGLLNILGNASAAMTAAWREALDAGMFANFPSGLIAKSATRQNTSDIRVGVGQFTAVDTNGKSIKDVVADLPFHDVTPGLMTLIDKITAQAKEAGGQPDIPVGEGTANIPVGTMIALIEQATKVMSAAHKGMHTAQSEELDILTDLFREDPEAFWRTNKKCRRENWDEKKLISALDTCTLVPRSDPNIPSHIHRVMKAVALIQVIQIGPFAAMTNMKEAYLRVLRALREDPAGLVIDAPPPSDKPSPEEVSADAKKIAAEAKTLEAQAKGAKVAMEAQQFPHKERMQEKELQGQADLKSVDLAKELVQQHGETERQKHRAGLDVRDAALKASQHALDVRTQTHKAALDTFTALKPDTVKE